MKWLTTGEFLHVDFSIAADFCSQVSGKCVYAGYTYAVQTS